MIIINRRIYCRLMEYVKCYNKYGYCRCLSNFPIIYPYPYLDKPVLPNQIKDIY